MNSDKSRTDTVAVFFVSFWSLFAFTASRAATDPSEAAAVGAVPVVSWLRLSQTDPCVTSWTGIGCTKLGQTYHITSIRVANETSQTVSKLLSVVSRLPYSQSLQISNTVSGTYFTIPESIGNLQKLKNLELVDNGAYLRGEIPASLGNLTGLQRLVMSGNELEGRIPETVCSLSSLVYLDMEANRLSGSIPSCISSLSQLESLNLGSNRLTGRIPDQFGQLRHLVLEDNLLQGEIPLSLFNLTSLQTLRLGRNLLNGPLSSQLTRLNSLQVLDLSSNNITGSIPSSIGELTQLVEMKLFSMGLHGSIPSEIGNLRSLSELCLQSNYLSGSLPGTLSTVQKLKHLQLQGNALSGKIPGYIFQNMSVLQGIYLQNNNLSGPFPVEVTGIGSVSALDISNNFLDGQLPDQIGKMSNLEWLLLAGNRFSGEVPVSIQTLPKLKLLDLSNNLLNTSGMLNMTTVQHDITSSDDTSDSETTTSDSLAINAGGPDHQPFQADNVFVTSVGYFLANPACSSTSASWAVALSGSSGSSRIVSTNSSINVSNSVGIDTNFVASNRELYTTARVGGDSITYYGRCMKPGRYTVELHFVELEETLAGRRVLDVYIQNTLVYSRLDIVGSTGSAMVPLVETNQAEISEDGSLKIELRGTGSWNSSKDQYKGPTISAIRAYTNETSGSGSHKSRVLWAILGSSIGILGIICVGLFTGLVCWLRRVEKRVRKAQDEDEEDEEHHITDINSLSKSSSHLVFFDYSELVEFTDKFSSDNLLGQGAHGKVFKGVLPDGGFVAIKQLVHRTPTCRKWFHHELQVISSVRHRNLVPLIGCCIDRGFPLLVCEYMPNGSLQNALFSKESGVVELLTWELRCRIALDVARGLQYLHEDCASKMKIIHRDVKPGNILLDQEMRAHISDFGLAKLIDHDQQEFVVSSVMGTRGYLAPEYVLNGQLSEKVDVYSYGIVLLEIVSGRKGMQSSMNLSMPEPVSIDEWAWEALTSDHISALADSRLGGCYPLDEIVRVVQIAMWCTQGLPEMRPCMGQVTQMLEHQIGVPELPSERMSWEDFKDIAASNTFGTTATSSSIWETMNGSTVSGGYHTAHNSTLPAPT